MPEKANKSECAQNGAIPMPLLPLVKSVSFSVSSEHRSHGQDFIYSNSICFFFLSNFQFERKKTNNCWRIKIVLWTGQFNMISRNLRPFKMALPASDS